MDTTQLTIHSGLNTIGGNIMSITHGNHRLITDFGALVGKQVEMDGDPSTTERLYRQGDIPQIQDIYRGDFDFAYKGDYETRVLISHLHLDHVGSLGHLHPEIPVMMSEEAADFYRELAATGFLPEYQINLQGLSYLETHEFGPFTIKFVPSDHDTRGISAIFIETPDGKIIYSGDLRLSGFYPERVFQMVGHAYDFKPDLLFLEGTSFSHLDREPSPSDLELNTIIETLEAPNERIVLQHIDNLLKAHPDQLFAFNGYPQNIDRLIFLAQILAKHNRQLVLQEGMAQLMKPYLGDIEVLISPEVDPQAFATNPNQYLIQVDEDTYPELFQLPGGIHIHSNGSPLGTYMAGYEEYIRELDQHGWSVYNAGTSGHGGTSDILPIAYGIQATYTVPWHTANNEYYRTQLQEAGINTWLPQEGRTYHLADILKEEDRIG